MVVFAPLSTEMVERVSDPDAAVAEPNAHATFAAPSANISWFTGNLSAFDDARLFPIDTASIVASNAIASADRAASRTPIMSKFDFCACVFRQDIANSGAYEQRYALGRQAFCPMF